MAEANPSSSFPQPNQYYMQPWGAPSPLASSSLQGALVKPPSNEFARPEETQSMQSLLENALGRSITLVFWYKASSDPVRLQLEIPTFPYFQLTQFPNLIGDLSLSNATYVDFYNENTGHWEQRPINAVSQLRREQRLLLRARKSLLEGLSEDECVGLRDEVGMQSKPATAPSAPAPTNIAVVPPTPDEDRKRAMDEGETAPPSKYHAGNGLSDAPPQSNQTFNFSSGQSAFPMGPALPPTSGVAVSIDGVALPAAGATAVPAQFLPENSDANPNSTGKRYMFSSYSPSPVPLPPHVVAPLNPAVQIPYHPHPPLKRWPNDYTVSEIAEGFRQMDTLIAQRPSVTQRIAFERVFGCRYVKSTVCRHRGVWRRADAGVRESFEKLGSDERAVWGEFVRRVEGRQSGKVLDGGMMEHPSHPRHLEDVDEGDESAMSSPNAPRMQSQVPASIGPPVHPSMQRPMVNGTTPLYETNVQTVSA